MTTAFFSDYPVSPLLAPGSLSFSITVPTHAVPREQSVSFFFLLLLQTPGVDYLQGGQTLAVKLVRDF